MRTRFAVYGAQTKPQVLLIGDDVARHECWEDAVQHVAAATGIAREQLWFRPARDALQVFNGWSCERQEPVARVYDPVQYQAAKSRGDLADEPPFTPGRSILSGPAAHDHTTMKKAPATREAKPNKRSFLVLQPMTWEGTERQPEDRIEWAKPGAGKLIDGLIADGKIREIKRGRPPKAPTVETFRALDEERAEAMQPQTSAPGTTEAVFELLDPATIAPSPVNPRRHFDEDAMDELVESVRGHGVRQPIQVRRVPDGAWVVQKGLGSIKWTLYCPAAPLLAAKLPTKIFQSAFLTEEAAIAGLPRYEIIAGERRWRAARLAGCATIRAIVEVADDIEAGELQTIENLQRADLSPIEEASGYQHMLGLPGYGMDRLAKRTGKSESAIRGKLKLLNLPEDVQTAVEQKLLPPATAELIGRLKPEMQAKAAEQILPPKNRGDGSRTDTLSFRDAREVVEELKAEEKEAELRATAAKKAQEEGYTVLEGELARGVISYGDRVTHNCGYVAALDVCPRDPQGRTWQAIVDWSNARDIEGIIVVSKLAVIVNAYRPATGRHRQEFSAVAVYARDQVNVLLKHLGLWSVEGSAQAKAQGEKRRAAEKKARDEEAMVRDFEVITAHAARGRNPREVLLSAVWAATHGYTPWADKVARRHGWMDPDEKMGRGVGIVRSMATDLELAELQALVVELAMFQMGTEENFYAKGRSELRRLFDLEYDGAADVDAETEDLEEATP